MTRIVHDQFGKKLLCTLLEPFGSVQTDHELGGEVQHADLTFFPAAQPGERPLEVGVLRELASRPCMLEPFRAPLSQRVVRSCLLKLYSLHEALLRQARREKRTVLERQLPLLWVLMAEGSATLVRAFGGKLASTQGIYELPSALKAGLIAIDELAVGPETLWLRLLGRGEVQARAIQEVLSLPRTHPLRHPALTLLLQWRILLSRRARLTRVEKEVMMNLSVDFDEWEEQAERRGKLEGKLEGRLEGKLEGELSGKQKLLLKLLRLKFGPLAPEVEAQVQALETPESLDELAERILTAARLEDLELGRKS